MEGPRGWYYRGYVPHIDAGSVPQFLTWRLEDSLPAKVIEVWRRELRGLPDSDRKREMWRRTEQYLDAGHGSLILRNPIAGQIVQATLIHDHNIKYSLRSWVVMPNHVHCILTPLPGFTLETILRTIK
ncbi:MAG: transposase, partial [Fimbriimonadaceae bacterium]